MTRLADRLKTSPHSASAPWRVALAVALCAASLLCALPAGAAATVDALRKEGFAVNVALFQTGNGLRARAVVECEVFDSAGWKRLNLIKGQFVRLDMVKAPQPDRVYTIAVKAFGPFDKSTARRFADEVRGALGLDTRVARLTVGARPDLKDAPYGALAVCIGNFDSEAEAAALLPRVQARYRDARVVRPKTGTLPRAQVRVTSVSGDPLGVFQAPLTIRPAPSVDADAAGEALAVGVISSGKSDWRSGYTSDIICPGVVFIDTDGKRLLTAVNRAHVDQYLRGVVIAEMGTAPLEALKAQSIASRSEALSRVDTNTYTDPLFDLCSTQRTQVYKGLKAATALGDRAIAETAYQVMFHDGQVVEAAYSANCGGMTASSEDIWKGKATPYLRGRFDASTPAKPDLRTNDNAYQFIASLPEVYSNPNGSKVIPEREQGYFRWRERLTAEKLTKTVNLRYRVGTVLDIRVLERSSTGRAQTIEIVGDAKSVKVSGYGGIRDALGGVFSTFFVIARERDESGALVAVSLYGAGYGHGVGMCQTGARRMAAEGFTSSEILQHYYSGVVVGTAI